MTTAPNLKQTRHLAHRRISALRRHALAIGLALDGLQQPDLDAFQVGDIAEIRAGRDAGVLIRITRVIDAGVRGFRLSQVNPRNIQTIHDAWQPDELARVGHTERVGPYPLQQQIMPTLEEQAEAFRRVCIAREEELKLRRKMKRQRFANSGRDSKTG